MHIIFSTVPNFFVVTSPADSLQGAMVGSFQTIQCTIITVGGVRQDSVIINWIGPRGNTITNDSRIIINPLTFYGGNATNNYFSSTLKFMNVMEEDKGKYTCNISILQTIESGVIELGPLIGMHWILYCNM